MAGELKHKDVGTQLSKTEWEDVNTHVLDAQEQGDVIYASSATQLTGLHHGTAGQALLTGGDAANPSWGSPTPATHAASHKNSGSDEILLHEFGEPTAAIEINLQQLNNLVLENVTSDPLEAIGQIFFRTDTLAAKVVSVAAGAETLQEYYDTGDDAYYGMYGNQWAMQSFTPAASHTVTKVWLRVYKVGTPSNPMTVSIFATDVGTGKPTGSALASGTLNPTSFTTDTAGEWKEFDLGAGTALTSGTKYAIVAKTAGGDTNNRVNWRYDNSSSSYAGGQQGQSLDGGSTWTLYTADNMFKEYAAATAGSLKTIAWVEDIDDTPVDGETAAPISSNWAYDHVAAADPHTGYRLESADHTHQTTGAQAGQLDHGLALTAASLLDDDHAFLPKVHYAKMLSWAGV